MSNSHKSLDFLFLAYWASSAYPSPDQFNAITGIARQNPIEGKRTGAYPIKKGGGYFMYHSTAD